MSPTLSVALPKLRVCHGRGRMVDDDRRPQHPIGDDTNEQEDRDHDRRNEVFHCISR